MWYALAAIAGAVAVWLAYKISNHKARTHWKSRCIYLPSRSDAPYSYPISVEVTYVGPEPKVLVADVSENVPTWVAV